MKKRVCDICDRQIGLYKNDYVIVKEKYHGPTGLCESPYLATHRHEICKRCYNELIKEIQNKLK